MEIVESPTMEITLTMGVGRCGTEKDNDYDEDDMKGDKMYDTNKLTNKQTLSC